MTSILVHGALITAAVLATARDSISAPKPVPAKVIYVQPTNVPEPPPRPVETPAPIRTDQLPVVTQVALPRFDAPIDVPVGIPPIDPNAIATDFADRGHVSNAVCSIACSSSSGVADTSRTWTAADVLMALRESPVAPRYPEALRRSGIDGSVVVKFIVDTTGRVDMSTFEIVRSDHELFSNAIRPTIERLRFNPAIIAGKKTRVTAMMPFSFTLK